MNERINTKCLNIKWNENADEQNKVWRSRREREKKVLRELKRYLNVISITQFFYHYLVLHKNDMPGDVCNSYEIYTHLMYLPQGLSLSRASCPSRLVSFVAVFVVDLPLAATSRYEKAIFPSFSRV